MSITTLVVILGSGVLLREGIVSFLQNTRYRVTAITHSDSEELPHAPGLSAARQTLAIVGVDQQNGNLDRAASVVGRLRSIMPQAKVALLVETSATFDLKSVLPLSADAYLVNITSRDLLLKALELTLMGQRVFVLGNLAATTTTEDDKISDHVLLSSGSSRLDHRQLSARECQVLKWLAHGKSNKVIARLCNAAESTIKVHIKAILRKTNTQNRTQAAIWAIEHGFRGASSERNADMVVDAPTLSPAGKMESVKL